MTAATLVLAALVAPPAGPVLWRGRPLAEEKSVRYFSILPMREPTVAARPRDAPELRWYDADDLLGRFVRYREPEVAFEIFKTSVKLGAEEQFKDVTRGERDYFLRFAASRGHHGALEFFDGKGEMLKEREYEYLLARYVHGYAWMRGVPPKTPGTPGYGAAAENPIRPYEADEALRKWLDRYSLTAHWFFQTASTNAVLPFLAFSPDKCPTNEVPLVVYIPGSGEQGPDLVRQFNQRACLEKVVSPEFQRRHPCRFLVIALPENANCGSGYGYPHMREERSEFYNDLILAYVRAAKAPAVDPRRIYLTGLGSGATIANGMMLDHPGRFAAVAPVWQYPYQSIVHPRIPGNWRFYNPRKSDLPGSYARTKKAFAENARAAGGDCTFHEVDPAESGKWWWDAVWSGDEMWDWIFTKTAPAGPREGF